MPVTMQMGIRNVLVPGEPKVCQYLDHLHFPTLWGQFYTDTMFSQMKLTRGNKAAQVFTNGLGYDCFYPQKTKSKADSALMLFIHDVGIPPVLVSDNAPEEIHGRFHKTCQRY